MQPCRGTAWSLIEPMFQRGSVSSRAVYLHRQEGHRGDGPRCLENPRSEGAESTLTENAAPPFQAEPTQNNARTTKNCTSTYLNYYADSHCGVFFTRVAKQPVCSIIPRSGITNRQQRCTTSVAFCRMCLQQFCMGTELFPATLEGLKNGSGGMLTVQSLKQSP